MNGVYPCILIYMLIELYKGQMLCWGHDGIRRVVVSDFLRCYRLMRAQISGILSTVQCSAKEQVLKQQKYPEVPPQELSNR